MRVKSMVKSGVVGAVVCLFVSAMSAGMAAAGPSGQPVPFSDLDVKLGVRSRYDVVTGRLTLAKEGMTLTLVNGMDRMLLNGKVMPLRDRFVLSNGIVHLPVDVLAVVGRKGPVPASEEQAPSAGRPAARANFKVVIDPGHGGDHAENVSAGGLYEKEVNLDVSLRLRALLEERGFDVVMTRDRDVHLDPNVREDLDRRVVISNREMPDLFVSIHSNHTDDNNVRGYEIFVAREETEAVRETKVQAMTMSEVRDRSGHQEIRDPREAKRWAERILDLNDQRSRIAAEEIHSGFLGSLSTEDRGIKEAGFYVIKWSRSPAVLVELEFLSSRQGARDLGSAAHRQKLAKLLADAIVRTKDRYRQWSRR